MTVAGASAVAGGVLAFVAGVLLLAFFATGKEGWGRANDAASAAFSLLLIPAAFAIYGRYAPGNRWPVGIITTVGLGAMVVGAAASALTSAGRLTVRQLMVWQGGSFGVLFLWVGGVGAWILREEGLPVGLGWLGLASFALVAVGALDVVRVVRRRGGLSALQGMTRPPPIAAGAVIAGFVAFPAWCVWLGLSL